MMTEEDDIDLPLTQEMADVDLMPKNGPNSSSSTLLLAASSSEEKTGEEDIEIIEKDICAESEENLENDKVGVSDKDDENLSSDGLMNVNKDNGRKLDSDFALAAEKSKELFGDSHGDDAFGIVQEKVIKQSDSASKLFESSDNSKEYTGEVTINESFEIIGSMKSFDNQDNQGYLSKGVKESFSVGELDNKGNNNGNKSQLESSFETLSIKNQSQNPMQQFQASFTNENQSMITATGATNSNMPAMNYMNAFNSINSQQHASSIANPNQVATTSVTHVEGQQYTQNQGYSSQSNEQMTSGYVPGAGFPPTALGGITQGAQQQISYGYQEPTSSIQNTPISISNQAAHIQSLHSAQSAQLASRHASFHQGAQAHSSNHGLYQSTQVNNAPSFQGAQVNGMESTSYQGAQSQIQVGTVHNDMSYYNNSEQNTIPMLNVANYNQGAAKQDFLSSPYTNTAAPSTIGNSFMYTSPISSVIPGYNTDQNSQQFQAPPQQQTPQPPAGLFVPELYGSPASSSNKVDIFVPAAPVLEIKSQQLSSPTAFNSVNDYQQSRGTNNFMPEIPAFQQVPLSMQQQRNFHASHQDPGLLEWVKRNMGQEWSEGAKKLGQQIIEKTKHTIGWFGEVIDYGGTKLPATKSATDTVLTTLDPGMEEYLNPVMNLGIASLDNKIVTGIRQGFRSVFGHTATRGHMTQHSLANLPIGFDAGVKATREKLDIISSVNFQFNGECVFISSSPFLTELQQGRWSCMFCIGLKDIRRQIELHSFSQPISIPSQCVSIAYNKTHPDEFQQTLGYSITIDEAVRLYKPYPPDQDWCFTLTGMPVDALLASASQGLAADYRREMENPAINTAETISILQ